MQASDHLQETHGATSTPVLEPQEHVRSILVLNSCETYCRYLRETMLCNGPITASTAFEVTLEHLYSSRTTCACHIFPLCHLETKKAYVTAFPVHTKTSHTHNQIDGLKTWAQFKLVQSIEHNTLNHTSTFFLFEGSRTTGNSSLRVPCKTPTWPVSPLVSACCHRGRPSASAPALDRRSSHRRCGAVDECRPPGAARNES